MSKAIEIDTRTFIRFWLVLLGIGLVILFLYKALTGLIIVGISIFLALALRPLVRKFNGFLSKLFGGTKNSHKTTSAVLAYSIIVVALITIIAIVGPVIINETSKFVQQLPANFEKSLGGWDGINNLGRNIGIDNLQSEITKALTALSEEIITNLGNTVITSVSTIADILMKGVLILILTLLFLLEGPGIMNAFWDKLGSRKEDAKSTLAIRRTLSRMANVVSAYVSNQITVALLDGLATIVFIAILSIIFHISLSLAIPMGLLAFVFYLIPMFGQVISAALIGLVLAFSSPAAAITFLIIYIVYAQIENNIVAPKIQGDSLKLPAVVILVAMTIGMYMFGLIGAIIAIPIAGCIRVFIEEYPNIKSSKE